MDTLEIRVKGLSKELRARGFLVRRNVMSCCRSCAAVELNAPDGQPAFWTFGGQGRAVYIKDDEAYAMRNRYGYRDAVAPGLVYWNHDGLVDDGELTENGKFLINALDRYGIHYDWNRTEGSCVVVDFDKSTVVANEERAKTRLVDTMTFV